MEFAGDCWMGCRESKMVRMMPLNPNQSVLPDGHGAQALPMLQPPEPPKYDKIPLMDDAGSRKEAPLKRKAQANKAPKPRKPKKVAATRNEMANGSVSRGGNVRKSLDVVIIGIHLDISGIPASVCSCTGTP